MTGMSMPQHPWYGAAAGYLGMWMAMMVPMMLPSLVPMLWRYRRSVLGVRGIHRHGLTALVGVGYFAVWAVLGMAAHAVGAGVMAVEMRLGSVTRWLPAVAGVVLLLAGGCSSPRGRRGRWHSAVKRQGAALDPRSTLSGLGGMASGWACDAVSAVAA